MCHLIFMGIIFTQFVQNAEWVIFMVTISYSVSILTAEPAVRRSNERIYQPIQLIRFYTPAQYMS